MKLLARLIPILLGVAVLGFFVWWTVPPFEVKIVWRPDDTPGPRFIPAPPKPPALQTQATPAATNVTVPALTATTPAQAAPAATTADAAKPEPEPATPAARVPQAAPAKLKSIPRSEETKRILLAQEAAEAERIAALQTSTESKTKATGETKRYFNVKVRDAATLSSQGVVIRLAGIRAHDPAETCKDEEGKDWACGAQAKASLTRLIRGRSIICVLPGSGEKPDLTMRCAVVGVDLSTWMVRQGWAQPKEPADQALAAAVQSAKSERAGQWRNAE